MELDAIFVRATKLLLWDSKDSEEQLRSLLEDAIKQRHPNKSLGNIPIKREEQVPRKESSKPSHKGSDKRNYEKPSQDENCDARSPAKKTSEVAKTTTPPVAVPPPRAAVVSSQSRSRDDDDRGYGLEISLEDDLSCTICGGMEVGVGNHLVECLECHTLYHQECHSPPILESDFNDPQSAWCCSACTRVVANPSNTPVKTPVKSATTVKPSLKFDTVQAQNLMKRMKTKVDASSDVLSQLGGGGLTEGMGMAGLAARLQPSSAAQSASKSFGGTKSSSPGARDSKAPSQPSTLGKPGVPNPNVVHKRLSIMKKIAARQQEQRKHIK